MRSRWQQFLFLAPLMLVMVPFLIWPALLGLFTSFTNYVPFQHTPVQFVGLENYADILSDSDFQAATHNIIVFTVITTTVELAMGVTIAYSLRRPFRGRSLVRFLLLLPWLVSPVANGVMWHFLFNSQVGIVNFWPALLRLPQPPPPLSSGLAIFSVMAVDIWRKVPLVSFLAVPGVLAIPSEQWDQAAIEGMSLYNRIRHVVLPHVWLLLLTITLLLIGDSLGTAEGLWELTSGGPGSETITPGLYSYARAFHSNNFSRGATSAWLIALAIIVIGAGYVLLSRREVNA